MPYRNLKGAKRCFYHKGEVILKEEEPIYFVYYLVEGIIYRKNILEKGDESIEAVKYPNKGLASVLGLFAVFRAENTLVRSDFIAKTDCVCYKIPCDSFLYYAKERPETLIEIIQFSLEISDNLREQLVARTNSAISERLCRFLLEQGKETEDHRLIVSYSNIEMAEILKVHKITVAKIL